MNGMGELVIIDKKFTLAWIIHVYISNLHTILINI